MSAKKAESADHLLFLHEECKNKHSHIWRNAGVKWGGFNWLVKQYIPPNVHYCIYDVNLSLEGSDGHQHAEQKPVTHGHTAGQTNELDNDVL